MLALLATAVAIGPETVQADFEDDAGVHSEAVMKLARLGVFDGTECGEGLFCPSEPVLRWTMAVWTVRVLDSIEPRDGVPGDGQLRVTQSRFVDVEDGVWWLPYVERMADLGITRGCAVNPARYCPDEPVTRAQMASFLQRAFGLVASGSALFFVDVGQSVHTDAIQALAEAGITRGCAVNPARFCPDEPVTRAQMASFLQRAFVSFGGVCPTEDNSADQSTGAGAGGGGSGGGGSGGGGSGGGGGGNRTRVRTPTEPGAPTDLKLLVHDRALQVSWKAPGDDGRQPITDYRLQWRSGDNQLSESDPSVTVAGGVLNRRIGSLDNGTQYYVRVRAINDVGEGPWLTPPASATPAAAPGVPREMMIEPGNQKLTVTWQPPAANGGSPVTGYLVQWKDTGEEFSDTERRATVTDPRHQIPSLDNGSTYTVQVRAVNLAGTGPPASETGVPVSVPGPPTSLTFRSSMGNLLVLWDEPDNDGGSPITGYLVQWKDTGEEFSDTERRATVTDPRHQITGLTIGNEHTVSVAAINATGTGPAVTGSLLLVENPGVPREMMIEPGNQKLTVTWQPPAANGGSPVTGYLVQWKDTGEEFSDTERRATVTDPRHQIPSLDNGSTYTVQVRAVNLAGTGPPASETGVPVSVPGPPTSLTFRSSMGNLLVLWDEPDNDGGSPITGYLVQWKDTGEEFSDTERRATVTDPRHQITGLTIGNEHTVSVAAINATGTGPAVTGSLLLVENPGVPREMMIEPGNQKLTVTWQPPAANGGSPVTGYLVQWKDTGEEFSDTERRATVTDPRHQIPSLDNGSTYTVQVRAVNLAGTGPPASETGVPVSVPGPPTSLTFRSSMGNLLVLWDEPDNDGGSPITGYLVQWKDTGEEFSDTERRATVTDPRHQITGLTIGNEHTVSVAAINATGTGPAVTGSLLLVENPGVPREMMIEPGNQKLTVTWQPPAANGGSPVTGYLVQWKDTGEEFSDTERRATVTDPRHQIPSLDNGSTYTVQVRAVNLAGTGPPASETGVPVSVPGPPTSLTFRSSMGNLLVLWDEPDNDGGSPITGYLVQWKDTGEEFSDTERRATVTDPRHQITGLTIGNEHTVSVAAINATGTGPAVTGSLLLVENPGVPREMMIEPGNQKLTVTWQPPAANGGSPVTGYLVQWKDTGEEFSDTERRATVTDPRHQIPSLDNGSTYTVQVRAVNLAGTGPPASETGVPVSVPGPPTSLTFRSSMGNLLVSWDEPDNDGGSPITGYLVQWKDTGEEFSDTERRATVTDPRHQITGLTIGNEHTVSVAAINATGTGPAVTGSLLLVENPGAPNSPVVTARNQNLAVRWQPPSNEGSTPISEYRVLWKGAGEDYDDSACSQRRVTVSASGKLLAYIGPLRNGDSYDVRVIAVNVSGSGSPADTSGTPAAIPGRPLGLGAFSIDAGLYLAWDTPWNGGSPITEYRIQWKGTGQEYSETDRQATATVTSRSHEITGLTNGAKYIVRVIALNANGSSEIAETTGEPGDAPGPPASLSIPFAHAVFNLTYLEFEWSAPTDQGASPITRYWLSVRLGYENDYSKPKFTTGLDLEMDISCVFTYGLCNRTQHFVRVSAVNAQGVGPPIVKEFRPST